MSNNWMLRPVSGLKRNPWAHFDVYIEMTYYYKLNRVDERDVSHMV